MEFLYDAFSALAVIANGIPVAMFALSLGFALRPTGLAYIIGAIGCGVTGLVAPISMQGETIALAGSLGSNRTERLSIVALAGLIMLPLGLFGMLQVTIDFIGPTIFYSMLAGVGLFLARVGLIDMGMKDKRIGFSSIISAVIIYVLTADLIYTIIGSVLVALLATIKHSFVSAVDEISKEESIEDLDKIKLMKLNFKSIKVIRGGLALACLTIGGNIAYGSITGQIANKAANVDHLTIISAIADTTSAFFGGSPVESIISATGVAPNPVFSGVLMMSAFALIMFSGVLVKLAKYIPVGAISGFYFVLGALVTFPPNLQSALADDGNPVVVGMTMAITATVDPFIGMVAGYATKMLFMISGM